MQIQKIGSSVVYETKLIKANKLQYRIKLQTIQKGIYFTYKPLASKLNLNYHPFTTIDVKLGFQKYVNSYEHEVTKNFKIYWITKPKSGFKGGFECLYTWKLAAYVKMSKNTWSFKATLKLQFQIFASSRIQSFKQWTSNCKCCFKDCVKSPWVAIVWW